MGMRVRPPPRQICFAIKSDRDSRCPRVRRQDTLRPPRPCRRAVRSRRLPVDLESARLSGLSALAPATARGLSSRSIFRMDLHRPPTPRGLVPYAAASSLDSSLLIVGHTVCGQYGLLGRDLRRGPTRFLAEVLIPMKPEIRPIESLIAFLTTAIPSSIPDRFRRSIEGKMREVSDGVFWTSG